MDREHDGKHYRVIMAKLHGEDTMTEQSFHYPIEEWDEKDARRHCKDHDGKLFEKAED